MGTHIDNDLQFGIDTTMGTLTRVGDLIIIRTEDPVGVWDAVTTSVSTGQPAVAAVAEELAAQAVTVEITGPDGMVARLGAGVDSSRGLLGAGSRKVELGDRHATAALVRTRLRRADPRIGTAAAGAVLAAAAVTALARRRRRRRTRWELARAQVGSTVTGVAQRGMDALPTLAHGYDRARDLTAPRVAAAVSQAREAAGPRLEFAREQARSASSRMERYGPPARAAAQRGAATGAVALRSTRRVGAGALGVTGQALSRLGAALKPR